MGHPCRRGPTGASHRREVLPACPSCRVQHPGHRRHRLVRQGLHRARARPPRSPAARHLLPRRAQAVRGPPAVRRRPPAALVHRRRPRPAPADARACTASTTSCTPRRSSRSTPPSTTRSSSSRPTSSARRTWSRRAIDAGVKRVVALSTDKASSPINLYGATKLAADKLFISGNHYAAGLRHPVQRRALRQRHGQPRVGHPVLPQAGGRRQVAADHRPADDPVLHHAARRPCSSWSTRSTMMQGGELYVPRIPTMRIIDLAEAVAPGAETHDIGIRPGEKLHEEMISPDDGRRTLRVGDRYVVLPTISRVGLQPPAGGRAACRGLRLPVRHQRPVADTADDDRARLARVQDSDGCCDPVRPPVDRRRRRRGGRRGAARRLAHHGPGGRPVRGGARRAVGGHRRRHAAPRAPPRCTPPMPRLELGPATR